MPTTAKCIPRTEQVHFDITTEANLENGSCHWCQKPRVYVPAVSKYVASFAGLTTEIIESTKL